MVILTIKSKKKTVKKKAVKKKVAKKPAKKAVKKKVSKKKSIKKSFELKKVFGDECFYMIDGSVLSDLNELSEAYDRMSEDIFNYHVSEEKNDFANWILNIFQEKELAKNIEKQKTPEKCHVVMLKFFLKHK